MQIKVVFKGVHFLFAYDINVPDEEIKERICDVFACEVHELEIEVQQVHT